MVLVSPEVLIGAKKGKFLVNSNTEKARIFDVPVDIVSFADILEKADSAVKTGDKIKIMYANVHTMNLAYVSPGYRDILRSADLVYCDGAGVRWGARLLNYRLGPRMTGADWIWDLGAWAGRKGHSIFFLGAKEDVARRAINKLQDTFPDLRVAGYHHGYFMKEGKENERVAELINRSDADILLVGFGSPLQEEWIDENAAHLDVPVIWGMGAVMDYVAGKVPRAPRWMLDHNLEWLYRLMVEPGRLWKRYLIGNPLFFLRILKYKFTRRLSNRTM